MEVAYRIGIWAYKGLMKVAAQFVDKAAQFVEGRKHVFEFLERQHFDDGKTIWVHAASVGEFEQVRVFIETIKQDYPTYKIVLSFFSPSGYELRKNYPFADYICYLPLDTAENAEKFISLIKPTFAVFVKYEFWHFYIKELEKQKIPVLSISSIFRADQVYFKQKFYGDILKRISYFFVQNEVSKQLVEQLGIKSVVVNGDTRFDRVQQIYEQKKDIDLVKRFTENQITMVCGSVWKQDMAVLIPFINSHPTWKFVIAPHEINKQEILHYQQTIKGKSVCYSEHENVAAQVLFIDNVGMLSSLYQYGKYAYVGGSFGKGLHNVLEPAINNIPVFFGNKKYSKFQEALDLIDLNCAFAIADVTQLEEKTSLLEKENTHYLQISEKISTYMKQNVGATARIVDFCKLNYLK